MRMRYPGLLFLLVFSVAILGGTLAFAKVNLTDVPEPSYDPAAAAMFSTSAPALIVPGIIPLTPGLTGAAIECFDFNTNPAFNGNFLFIPPDPIDAAGLEHVINIGNCIIEWRPKAAPLNIPQFIDDLDGFFAGTPGALALGTPPTNVFDPKVTYDQYSNRFIVIALQRVTAPALASRILVAISKTSDPNAGWWLHSINSTLTIGGVARWADYPGLACDDDAVYITANMFNAAGTTYGGSRVWVIQKAPTYAGPNGSIVSAVYDAYGLTGTAALATTTQPTHMWGPEPALVGTFLVSYSGLSDGTNEYLDLIRLDNPTGVVAFNFQQIPVGNIDNTAVGTLPDAPQLGTPRLIEVNDRRALNAVWRNNNLYMCAELLPPGGADAGQVTAHWWRVNTTVLAALTAADQGNVGSEDLGVGTYTYFPSVHVDFCENMAIGFSASNALIYAGAYYASRLVSDAPGTIGNTATLQLGTDWYVRTFSNNPAARNRWGDYSGLSLCPVDQSTFWVYNEYACTRGTPTTVGGVTEDGRWCTKLGRFSMCQPVATAISFFDAVAKDGTVSLRAMFRSNLGVEAVNVYRGAGTGDLRVIETVYGGGESFTYTDRTARPGETYTYKIGVRDPDGEYFSPAVKVSVAGLSVTLGQNAPNPFNPTTTISFTLPERELVTVSIYDASGKLVRTLVNDVRDYGANQVTWDGRDNAGTTVGSGVYFYRLTAGKFTESKKMVMLK